MEAKANTHPHNNTHLFNNICRYLKKVRQKHRLLGNFHIYTFIKNPAEPFVYAHWFFRLSQFDVARISTSTKWK